MVLRYTNDELVNAITRAAHIPTAQVTFTDADLLAFSDEETQDGILPQILSVRENYYLTYIELPLNAEQRYDIPERAIAMALSDVKIRVDNTLQNVTRIEVSELMYTHQAPGPNWGWYIENNQLVLLGNPQAGVLRMYFYRWPNKNVLPTACAEVTDITGDDVTVASLPTTFSIATPLDFIKAQPGFDLLGLDTTPIGINATTLTFAPGEVPARLAVGDWLALSGETPVAQIPREFRPLLVQRVVVRVYETQGYLDKKKVALDTLKEKEAALFKLINPRVAESPKRMSAWNAFSGGQRRRGWFNGW